MSPRESLMNCKSCQFASDCPERKRLVQLAVCEACEHASGCKGHEKLLDTLVCERDTARSIA